MKAEVLVGCTLMLIGCGSSPLLPPQNATTTLVLSSAYKEGSTLGLCVTYDEKGDAILDTCPRAMKKIWGKDTTRSSTAASKPIDHKWALYRVTADGGVPGFSGKGGLLIAYETAVYARSVIEWKSEAMAEEDFQALQQSCSMQASSSTFSAIVTQEESGCTLRRIAVEGQAGAPTWNISAIAAQGQELGHPKNFWAQTPDVGEPPKDAACTDDRIAVRVHVMGFGQFCREVVAPEQIRRLTKKAQRNVVEIEKLNSDITAAEKDKADLSEKLKTTKSDLDAAQTEQKTQKGQVEDFKQQIDSYKHQIDSYKQQVQDKDAEIGRLRSDLGAYTAQLKDALNQIDKARKQEQEPVPLPPLSTPPASTH